MFHPLELPDRQLRKLSLYVEIRDTYHDLYNSEATERKENTVRRDQLNALYDDFVRQFGNLNSPKNIDLIRMDNDNRTILSLERYKDGQALKADIFDHPVAFNKNELTHVDTSDEALSASLNKYGNVNLKYMTRLTGKTEDALLDDLKGRVFFNPLIKGYEIADKFIAGNVISKAEMIEGYIANHPGNDRASQSLDALRAAFPVPIPFEELDFNFGERWIPMGIYEKYASRLFRYRRQDHLRRQPRRVQRQRIRPWQRPHPRTILRQGREPPLRRTQPDEARHSEHLARHHQKKYW